jgi:hypothetical protein
VWSVQGLLLAFLLVTNIQPALVQYTLARQVADKTSTVLVSLGQFVVTNTPQSAAILTFAPALPIVASRAPASYDGQYLIDPYGYTQYLSMGLDKKWLPARTFGSPRQAQLQSAAQEWMRQAAAAADYVVMDDRGRYQLEPETVNAMRSDRTEILTWTDTAIWEKR